MNPDPSALEAFEAARPMLMGLAYRILGSYSEAEDVVQDTYLSWMSAGQDDIERPTGWLTTVCTRKAIDTLKSARRARTHYVGAWLPEPIHTHVVDTPETQLALSESVTMAFLLVLERLAPRERAAFLLHDVFAMSYQEVAASLDSSEQACRKLVSRARTNIRRTDTAQEAPRERQDQLVAAFGVAITTGSTDQLARLLSADVTLSADGGGKVVALRRTLEGAPEILTFIGNALSRGWRGSEITVEDLNSQRALIARRDGQIIAAVSFAYDTDFNVSNILIMRNPDKLASIDRSLLRPTS